MRRRGEIEVRSYRFCCGVSLWWFSKFVVEVVVEEIVDLNGEKGSDDDGEEVVMVVVVMLLLL
ncbi:hypothetical protein Sjap_018344 [Stephania japonica]|uniref:Uncharacterized protein n=1 Tax=Stephania japonica TaxID=461633 RepID=A0AAP0I7T9_9MAGN